MAATLAANPPVKNSLAGGTDYAYGDATTDVGTTTLTYGPGNALSVDVNNMGQQVTDYLATHPTITNKTLFVVWGGANDLLNATSTAVITAAATRDVGIVLRLVAAGASQFIVPNLPPLGLIPELNGMASNSAMATAAAAGYNQALAAGIAAIPLPPGGLNIRQLDIFTLFNTIVAPPFGGGFTNVTASSQGPPVNPLNANLNPDTYLFWDGLHPTTVGHHLIALAAANLIGPAITTTTTLASSAANANVGTTVTLTASVVATSSTPMGSITFMDGMNVLGSALAKGSASTATATFTTSALLAGTHNIVASYAGVNGFSSSTSMTLSEVVTAPAVTVAFSPSSINITSGSTGTSMLTVTPVGGLMGTATFQCGALPIHFSCSISPASLTLPGNNMAQSATVTIGTSAPSARFLMPSRPGSSSAPEIFTAFTFFPCVGLLGLAAFRRRSRAGARSWSLVAVLILLSGGAALGLSGCGGNNAASNKVPAGTYSVQVFTVINGANNTQALTVVVQ